MRLGDLAAEREADAGAVGFVVKNGTNRFDVSGRPLPFVVDVDLEPVAACFQPTDTSPPVSSDASTALRMMLMSSCSI